MATYLEQVVKEPNYRGNVVILLAGKYYAIRQPDSGLVIPFPRSSAVVTLVLNPAAINPKSVTTTIASYQFKLLDKDGIISKVHGDRALNLINQNVEIWLGRSDVGMDFADYYKLPVSRLSKTAKSDAGYTFTTRETTDRMNVPLYENKVRLQGDILAATTQIISKDAIDTFPDAGTFRLGQELVDYAAKNNLTRTFIDCGRGAFNTTPTDTDDNTDIYQAEIIQGVNPITLLLQLLTSGSGTGDYDVLSDGLAIPDTLIDVVGMEEIRDSYFPTAQFFMALYNIDSALSDLIEKQILMPCNLRFTYARESGLLSLAVLDKPIFEDEDDVLDHSSITTQPTSEVVDTDIVNAVQISWNYDEGSGQYLELSYYEDASSLAAYGPMTSPLNLEFQGVRDQSFVDAFAKAILGRLALPGPSIGFKTRINKSLLSIGDKPVLETTLLPSEFGDLNYANTLEVVSRAINWQTGDVTFKLAYTSTTGFRLCYIAPSDRILTWPAATIMQLDAGRGAFWKAGWKVRLFDLTAGAYASSQVNIIDSVADDEIYLDQPWVGITGAANRYVLKFPDYDDATPSQLRYCYISPTGANFKKKEKAYVIVP